MKTYARFTYEKENDLLQMKAITHNITCSKSAIETIKKVRNMFKINDKNIRTTSLTLF